MTKAQIQYIRDQEIDDDTLGSSSGYTPMLDFHMIVISKEELLYSDISRYRYRFDDSNELIERIQVHEVPSTEYDSSNGDAFEFADGTTHYYNYWVDLKSSATNKYLSDFYMYDAVMCIVPNPKYDVRTSELEVRI